MGFRIESDGTVSSGTLTGDLVEVNMAERFVITRWGHTFPWKGEPPAVECELSGLSNIADPALLDHGIASYQFDTNGDLVGITCGYEG